MFGEKLPRRAKETISRFGKRLRREYADAQVYLFGSYADGTWIEDSDFDIVVVSNRFEGRTFAKRVAAVRHLAPKNEPFEILAYTPVEFRKAMRRSIVIQDARRYWRRIL